MKLLTLIIAASAGVALSGAAPLSAQAQSRYVDRDYVEFDRYRDADRFDYRSADFENDRNRNGSYKDDGPVADYDDNYVEDYAPRKHRSYNHDGPRLGVHTPGIKRRLERQKRRVVRGVDNGDLTRREIRQIRDCIEDIRFKIKKAKYDGEVTYRERRNIHAMLDDSSRLIRRLKQNRRYSNVGY